MRVALLTLYLCVSASWAPAHQAAAAGPPVTVLKFAWDHSWNVDSGSGVGDATVQSVPPVPGFPAGVQGGYNLPGNRARRSAILAPPPRDDAGVSSGGTRPPKDVYTYTVKLRNCARRAIRAIDWEYVIVDPQSRAELARLKFKTNKNIGPGKTKTLSGSTWTPPTRTMSVQGLNRKGGPQAGESIEILRIQFADGSLWVR